MSTLSSANVTDVNLVLKERTHMRLYLNMLIFTHNLGNWLITSGTLASVAHHHHCHLYRRQPKHDGEAGDVIR